MKYYSKTILTDTLTKLEKKQYERLRKISILKDLPFSKWTKAELLNLIDEYETYYMIYCKILKSEDPINIKNFVETGIFEKMSLFEELKLGE